MNIYEPAAMVLDKEAEVWDAISYPSERDMCRRLAHEIRALPNPPSEPDLEKVQEALKRAFHNQNDSAINFVLRDGAKYLAAEGLRLPLQTALPVGLTINEEGIQHRIDAAVLKERWACAYLANHALEKDDADRMAGYKIADLIQARTTTPEIAGGPSTPAKEDVLGRASAAGESPAPEPLTPVLIGDSIYLQRADGARVFLRKW